VLAWLCEPFGSEIVRRALLAGLIVACLCAIVGTWVLLRGAAFLGDAMSHGVLPGVAAASVLGGNIFIGAMVAALAMAYGVSAISGSSRLSADSSIGLLLVGMLAAGVIIVSHSQSYAVDLTGFLFGDVLAVRASDIALLATALVLTATAAAVGRRAFVAASFDVRKATTLGLRPEIAAAALTVLIAVAIVASFRVVGTLLVFGLLIAPPAAAVIWANTIPRIMTAAAVIGCVAVSLGLVVSWHAGTAGGATIAAVAVGIFFCSLAASALRRHAVKATALLTAAAALAGCGGASEQAVTSTPPAVDEEAPPAGAQESAGPVTRLVLVDPDTGDTSVFDVIDEKETNVGRFGAVEKLSGDGRFGYLHTRDGLTVVDAGSWTFDHGDHNHYYVAAPAVAGTVNGGSNFVAADQTIAATLTGDGRVKLLDRERLGEHEIASPSMPVDELRDVAQVVPQRDGLLIVTESGQLQTVDEHGSVRRLAGDCPAAAGAAMTRRAVIFACGNGAIRVGIGGQEPAVTPIPFPANRPAAALGQPQHRDRHNLLAGIAGNEVWVLDSGRRTWSPVPAVGAVAVSTGDDNEVLVLTRDGALRAFDAVTGAETASVNLFSGGVPDAGPVPVIEVDSDRAYVNNAAAREIYEIDYGDSLRIARTLTTGVEPGLMVKAGR
jgi:ABC-type Mn2+/Zn2+ transport system permease subunit